MQSPSAGVGALTGGKLWGLRTLVKTPNPTLAGVSQAAPVEGAYHRYLVKFLLISALSLLIGAMHGMLQVLPPIRAWLDSIGSPYGGPGHMIDPLAHAHMNLVGGVVMLLMGVTYYLLPILSGRPIYSLKLVQHSFWLTTLGVYRRAAKVDDRDHSRVQVRIRAEGDETVLTFPLTRKPAPPATAGSAS